MAQKMSLIKEQLGTASNSLRTYSSLAGLSIPDRMAELNSYSQRYITLQICGGTDTYINDTKIDYSNSLIGRLVGGTSNTYYTITGFANTTSGRTIVTINNYSTVFTSCYQALNTTIAAIRQGEPDEGTLCDTQLNSTAIIDFGSTWSTTTTLKSLDTGENMPADVYMGAVAPYTTKSIRYWNGSSFYGAESFC
jgi:hypothetical protein